MLDDMYARELDEPKLCIERHAGRLDARRPVRYPESVENPLLRPPVPVVRAVAASW